MRAENLEEDEITTLVALQLLDKFCAREREEAWSQREEKCARRDARRTRTVDETPQLRLPVVGYERFLADNLVHQDFQIRLRSQMQQVDLLNFTRLISQLILKDDPRRKIPQKEPFELRWA